MMEENAAPEAGILETDPQIPESKFRDSFARFLRRFFLLLLTLVLMATGALALIFHSLFHGPSPTARDRVTAALLEDNRTSWIPGLFLDEAEIGQITGGQEG